MILIVVFFIKPVDTNFLLLVNPLVQDRLRLRKVFEVQKNMLNFHMNHKDFFWYKPDKARISTLISEIDETPGNTLVFHIFTTLHNARIFKISKNKYRTLQGDSSIKMYRLI